MPCLHTQSDDVTDQLCQSGSGVTTLSARRNGRHFADKHFQIDALGTDVVNLWTRQVRYYITFKVAKADTV